MVGILGFSRSQDGLKLKLFPENFEDIQVILEVRFPLIFNPNAVGFKFLNNLIRIIRNWLNFYIWVAFHQATTLNVRLKGQNFHIRTRSQYLTPALHGLKFKMMQLIIFGS